MIATYDVAIVGGCGHVGLPLGIALADSGLRVVLHDIDDRAVGLVNAGTLPFAEAGAAPVLRRVLDAGRLLAVDEPGVLREVDAVVVVVGTPIDEHLNPDLRAVPRAVAALAPHLRDEQLLVLRSTVYPGVTAMVERVLDHEGRHLDVAFCPERIAEGRAMVELFELPQIVAARTPAAFDRAAKLFRNLTHEIVPLEPEEAELAKLFTNTWRYVKFATANQFFMIANDYGLDFERIRSALAQDYPRAADLPGAGFAAGPCLFKDAMQLAAFNNNAFTLGQAAMLVNEGMPLYVVARMEKRWPLSKLTVACSAWPSKEARTTSARALPTS
jgi:UDP-N-acetyl-D-mannosaminuronic acid dehydrogenase